jgi:multiple sugar transport system substrate-binding protein
MPRKYLFIGAGVVGLLIIIVGALLFSSGNKPAPAPALQPVELIWWKPFEDSASVNELINAFQTANKGMTIRYVKKDIVTYEDELIRALAAGNGPDIFSIHNDWLPQHWDKITPAPSAIFTEKQFKDTFLDVVGTDFFKEGKVYAAPLSVDALALYYNKDILNSAGYPEPPKTWEEVKSAVQKISKQDVNGDFTYSGVAMGLASNVNRAVDVLNLLMLQNGTDFYNSVTGAVGFDQPKDAEEGGKYNPSAVALEFYTQFADPAKRTYTWNAKANNSVDAFSQNKLGMMLSYAYMRERIIQKSPSLNWDVAPVPQITKDGLKYNIANYWGEAVAKTKNWEATNPEKLDSKQLAAWNFIKFITSKENLDKYYAKKKLPASRKDMIQDQLNDTEIGVFADGALTAKSVFKPDANLFEGAFITMIEDVVLRGYKPVDAVTNAANKLRAVGVKK